MWCCRRYHVGRVHYGGVVFHILFHESAEAVVEAELGLTSGAECVAAAACEEFAVAVQLYAEFSGVFKSGVLHLHLECERAVRLGGVGGRQRSNGEVVVYTAGNAYLVDCSGVVAVVGGVEHQLYGLAGILC